MTTFAKKSIWCGLVFGTLAFLALSSEAATRTWRLDAGYQALYESNIYHSFADSSETSALLNVLETDLSWRIRQSRTLRHTLSAQIALDMYPSYSNRNKSSFGVTYEPAWHYRRGAKLSLQFDVARRNRDLIDDAGNVQARTLQRWETSASVANEYDVGHLSTELRYGYYKADYDEVAGLVSYDYHAYAGGAKVRYKILPSLRADLTFDNELRFYDQRRTYTLLYGAVKGRPFEIRHYTDNNLGFELGWKFYRNNEISADADFGRRKDNFENFYGYDEKQYRAAVRFQLVPRHETLVSARFKRKEYKNYYNSHVGRLNRIWIEYADVQIEHAYKFSEMVTLALYVRNYNKVSNDYQFDYHDLTAGTAVRFKL